MKAALVNYGRPQSSNPHAVPPASTEPISCREAGQAWQRTVKKPSLLSGTLRKNNLWDRNRTREKEGRTGEEK